MEHLGSSPYAFNSRSQMEYREMNENINKIIDDLGDKVQKEVILIQEKILLQFKQNLLEAQMNYRQLQKNRNDEVIKQNVLNLKNEQQKIFGNEEEKSLEMNKIYDKIKVDLKRTAEYQHELDLQIKYLTKQCILSRKKAQILDQEIKEYEIQKNRNHTIFVDKSNCLPKIKKNKLTQSFPSVDRAQNFSEKRLKAKIDSMKEYIDYLSKEQSTMQTIVSKYDISTCKSQRQKNSLIQSILTDKQFKKYIYNILFTPSPSASYK